MADEPDTVRAGRRRVRITHPDRPLFHGITKRDLAQYYAEVAPAMVPHVRDRPLALHSFPAGIEGDGYFVKSAPKHFPDWVKRATVPKRDGGANRQALANDAASLAFLAGQNAIALHVFTSRADKLKQPDRVIFDLDPDEQSFAEIRATARELGELLRDLGLEPFAMTTGSRGLHVVTPIRRGPGFQEVHGFAKAVAERLVERHPDTLTIAFKVADRGGRMYVDVNSNAYAQHAIAAYSPRALPKAPVAAPLRWDELSDRHLKAQRFTVRSMPDRLADGGDPWQGIGSHARSLAKAAKAL